MKKIIPFLAIILIPILMRGQKLLPDERSKRIEAIKQYINDTKQNAPYYILDSLIEGYQKGLSGSSVKEGKLGATSLTVTDKGADVKINLTNFRGLYLGFSIAGTGENGFVNVVKDGKYQSSLSASAVINFFPASASGFFKPSDAWQTREIVTKHFRSFKPLREDDPFDAQKELAFINTSIRSLREYEELLLKKFGAKDESTQQQTQKDISIDKSDADIIIKGRMARDTLIALSYLPKDYLNIQNVRKRIASIPSEVEHNTLRDKKFLSKVEKELMDAKWTAFRMHWWTLKPSFNVKPYKMINPDLPKDNFADTYNDNFFSLALSWNWTTRRTTGNQFQYTLTPTITLSNARDFSSLTEQTITKTQQLDINGTSVEEVLWSTNGYTQMAQRSWAWSLEFPFIFFWNKKNIGFEIAGRIGDNNPRKDNYGAKLGVYIPVEIKEGTPVWIEPMIRIGKLGNTKKNDKGVEEPLSFWKDNVEFGFNLSVAIPAFKLFSSK